MPTAVHMQEAPAGLAATVTQNVDPSVIRFTHSAIEVCAQQYLKLSVIAPETLKRVADRTATAMREQSVWLIILIDHC